VLKNKIIFRPIVTWVAAPTHMTYIIVLTILDPWRPAVTGTRWSPDQRDRMSLVRIIQKTPPLGGAGGVKLVHSSFLRTKKTYSPFTIELSGFHPLQRSAKRQEALAHYSPFTISLVIAMSRRRRSNLIFSPTNHCATTRDLHYCAHHSPSS
jgi:hypothetical protein